MLKPPRRLVREAWTPISSDDCAILGVSAEDVIDGGGEVILDIDPIKLTELVVLSRERLGESARG